MNFVIASTNLSAEEMARSASCAVIAGKTE